MTDPVWIIGMLSLIIWLVFDRFTANSRITLLEKRLANNEMSVDRIILAIIDFEENEDA